MLGTVKGWVVGQGLAIIAAAAVVNAHNANAAVQLPAGLKADRLLVLKSKHVLLILNGGTVLDTFRVAPGRDPVRPKNRAGDGRTPEGHYVLDWRNAKSRFYRSIHISYPDASDIKQARHLNVSPGGDIMIHGLPKGAEEIGTDQTKWDWTDGCIAVSNSEMDEIWRLVDDGTPIDILP